MKRSPSFSSRFWAFLSALWLAGLCFVPSLASAETIVLPDPLFTNQFTSVEAWVRLDTVEAIVLTESEYDDFTNSIWQATQDILDFAFPNIYRSIDDAISRVEGDFDSYSQISGNSGRNWRAFRASILSEFETLRDAIESEEVWVAQQLDVINDAVASLDTNNRTNVITSVTFGQEYGRTLPGGGCECPDYTVYLQGIYAVLFQWRNSFDQYTDDLLSILSSWDGNLTGFRDGLLTEFSSDQMLGRAVGLILHQIHEGYIFPTNVIERPLWVAFTNSVHFDGPVEVSGNVGVTNFVDLVHMLTNSVLNIKDAETEQERHDKMSADLSFMSGILDDDLEEPDQQTDQFEQVNVSRLSSVSSSVSSVIDSYETMFDSIPSEFPADIMVHPGFSIGPLEVSSMHWNPYSSERSGLNYLRQFMRSLWYVGFVVLIWYAVAIDILLIGSVVCVCYGVAFSKPQESIKGIRFFFGIFASMLGFSPPSSS